MQRIWPVVVAIGWGVLAVNPAGAGKLYKWTDKDGNVHYTDQPPPAAEAKSQEHKRFGDKPADLTLPYSLARAVKNFPVTLYNADCGDACTKAAALLAQRGVPFSDKNARDPAAGDELKALTGGKLEVPVLKLGSQVLRGFEENGWNQALDAAGYPRTAVVPAAVAAKAVAKPSTAKPEPRQDDKTSTQTAPQAPTPDAAK